MRKSAKYFFLLITLIPLLLSSAEAQQVNLRKWVVGGGGFLNAQVGENIYMSGMTAQTAIETVKPDEGWPGAKYVVHQGFWVPDGLKITDVEELPTAGNNSLRNYPNPFSASTTIEFTLEKSAQVKLYIYDVQGNIVAKILDEYRSEGTHTISWNGQNQFGTDVTAGSYMYELQVQPASSGANGFSSFNLKEIMVIVR